MPFCSIAPVPIRAACRIACLAGGLVLVSCTEDGGTPLAPSAQTELAAATAAPLFSQVSAGGTSTCGVTAAGKAYCWGLNADGEVGDGTLQQRLVPVAVAGNLVFRRISVGNSYACGVTTDDRAYCWGRGNFGQLGNGTTTSRSTPTPVAGSHRFRVIEAGVFTTCAVAASADRHGYCWGYNVQGQVGDGSRNTRRVTPVAVAGGRAWRQLSPEFSSSCGITTGNQAWCWGTDAHGQLGDNPERGGSTTPVMVAGGHAFTQLDAGSTHMCAVTAEHQAYCWGDGMGGAMGDGRTVDRFTPHAVAGGLSIERVTAGAAYTCAETSTNRTYCWGARALGNGTLNQPALKPVEVAGDHRFVQVSAGDLHACGITGTGAAWCWGYNDGGELGDGTTESRTVPTLVVGGP
jgi:alpha-tubulin suppressor-like RCC1 family protein